MAATVYYCGASLDGYIARSDDTIDWLTGYQGSYEGNGAAPVEGGYDEFYVSLHLIGADEYGAGLTAAMTFEQAIELASRAHAGHLDRYGEPELLHVLQVAVSVPAEARVVAALHDVLEDSDLTAEDLRAAGLGDVELDAVLLLTRAEDEPYEAYVERVVTAPGEAGRLARMVKVADARNNLARLTPEFEDRRERYERALARLTSA